MDDRQARDPQAAPSLPERLPLFPLSGSLFPGMPLPLHIFEQRYRKLLTDRDGIDPAFGIVLTRSGREVADEPVIHLIGTSASLLGIRRYPDGRADIVVRGERRFRVLETDWSGEYLVGTITWLDENPDDREPLGDLATAAVRAMTRLIAAATIASGVDLPELELPVDPTELSYTLSWTLWVNSWERQELLECRDTRERLERLIAIMRREERLLRTTGASGVPIDRPGERFLPN